MKDKITILLKNKEYRKVLENFLSLSTLQLVGMILPLITLPYVLRVLGFSNYGTVVLAGVLIAYFQSLTDYSFKITATRDVSLYKGSQKKINLIYSKVMTVKAIFFLFSFLIISLIIYIYPPFYDERKIFFISTLMLFGYVLFPEWFFQGIEEMKYITFLNLGIKIFFTLCVFLFIKEKEDYWVYPLLQGTGLIGAGLVSHIILFKKYNIRFRILKIEKIIKTISKNFPIFVNQFFPTLYHNTGTFLLGLFASAYFVGVYAAIKKMIDLSQVLLNILSRVFFPYLNRNKNSFHTYKKIIMTTSVTIIISILAMNKLIFLYLNVNYENAFIVLFFLSMSLFGVALYDLFGLNYFIVRRQDNLVMKNTIKCSLAGFLITLPLIAFFGIVGASISLCLTRLLMGTSLFLMYLEDSR